MSAIPPPNWISSVAGAQEAQKSATGARNKDAIDEANRTNNGRFAEKLQDVIDQDDRDGQVYSDSEGLGSQGRESGEESLLPEQDAPNIPQDEADKNDGHIDLQA